METSDLAAIGFASQMLAFTILSALFLGRRGASPFSRYLGVASASLCAGGRSGGTGDIQQQAI